MNTSRTDKEVFTISSICVGETAVSDSFARQLETELTAAQTRAEEYRSIARELADIADVFWTKGKAFNEQCKPDWIANESRFDEVEQRLEKMEAKQPSNLTGCDHQVCDCDLKLEEPVRRPKCNRNHNNSIYCRLCEEEREERNENQ